MKITIGIKALNEEAHIAASVESALAAVVPFGGEVVLADSGSTDRTIEIARSYPIRIVQLTNFDERCCGIGAQLAFENAFGDYFYLLDGDMVLQTAFIAAGLAFLEEHLDVAAVGGLVREINVQAEEFQIRAAAVAHESHWQPGDVDRLDCGGLYRTSAIRDVGWFADRNLHAFEEFDLGARLSARGWKLVRIAEPAIDHFGHQIGGYRLLWRRFCSGYLGASGEVLRGAFGKPHMRFVLLRFSHVRATLVVAIWWLLFLPAVMNGLFAGAALLVLTPLAFLTWRRGSMKLGLFSMASWNLVALALIGGLMRRRVPPQAGVAARRLQEPVRVAAVAAPS